MDSFECAVGPQADVKEFEYIVALQQTCPGYTRTSGTISSLDIMRFLKSRHAVDVTHEQAMDIVLGLGGGILSSNVRRGVAELVAAKHRHQDREQEEALKTLRYGSSSMNPGMLEEAVSQGGTDVPIPGQPPAAKTTYHERWQNLNASLQTKRKAKHVLEQATEKKAVLEEILRPKVVYLDIVQMLSVLFIPTITRYVKDWSVKNHAGKHMITAKPKSNVRPAKDFEDELERVRSRLAGESGHHRSAGTNSAAGNGSVSDYASVEVGLSEVSNYGTSVDNASRDGGPREDLGADSAGGTGTRVGEGGARELLNTVRLAGELAPKPDDMLEFILARMWRHIHEQTSIMNSKAGGSSDDDSKMEHDLLDGDAPMVTPEMVRALLIFHGDHERAYDSRLVQQMVAAAHSPSGRFDELALANAISSDISEWEVGCEDRTSTIVTDVFGEADPKSFQRIGTGSAGFSGVNSGEEGEETASSRKMSAGSPSYARNSNREGTSNMSDNQANEHSGSKRKKEESGIFSSSIGKGSYNNVADDEVHVQLITGEIIDSAKDQYGSAAVVILTWLTYICHGATYASLLLNLDWVQHDCDDPTLGCTLIVTIVNWLVLACLLSAFGFCVLIPLSYGNHPTRRSPTRQIVAMLLALAVTLIPFGFVAYFQEQSKKEGEEWINDPLFKAVVYVDVLLGCSVAFVYFLFLFQSIAKEFRSEHLWVTSDERGSTRLKHAATRKINVIMKNARRMHEAIIEITSEREEEENRAAQDNVTEEDALFENLRDSQSDPSFQNFLLHGEDRVTCGNIFWTWKRIISGEMFDHDGIWFPARLWIFQFGQIVIAVIVIFALIQFMDAAKKAADEAQDGLGEGLPDWVYQIVPTGQQVLWALIPATIVADTVMFFFIFIYLPSTAKTILKLRSGEYPSLGSPSFNEARVSPDTAHMNTANAIYGMVGGAALFYILISLFIFLFIWEFSRSFMMLLLAWGLGLTITIVLKMIVTSFFRKRFYRAFYRPNPSRANLSMLLLECWFIGLGGGVLVGRIAQFLLASAFWIGRIDEPFLAPNVSLVGYKFDYVPLNYRKDILVHEAHRHPFIERLGAMYLMRLRHKNFGSDAGGCWRQLFVLTLMPWMVKYRVSLEQRSVEAANDQRAETEQKRVEKETFVDDALVLGDNVKDGAQYVTDVGTGAVLGAVDATKDVVDQTGNAAKDLVNKTGVNSMFVEI